MAKCRKALALLLTVLMVFSLLPMTIAAEDPAESTQPVWPAEGSIKLDKDATAVEGQENLWEVTLGIQGKNYKTTSDVVLVIDCSGSMEGSRLTNTRKAAKAFGDKLLTNDSSTRIAIVTYIDEATAYNNGRFYGAGELEAFKTAVDAATYANGGTNQQAGIHVAQELLKSTESTGKLKNIVILSDGEATYSYPFVGGDLGRHGSWDLNSNWIKEWPTDAVPDYSNIIGSGGNFSLQNGNIQWTWTGKISGSSYSDQYGSFYYNSNGNLVCSNGKKSSDNGVATIWEANQAKAAGTTIFSVALQAGTDGENTLKACATDAAKGYFAIANNEPDVAGKLTSAFEAIAGSIAIAASDGVVNDPMGKDVKLSLSGTDPVITTDEAAYIAGRADVYISQGTATYNPDTKAINWTVGNVNEGANPTMKYRITLEGTPDTGAVLDANGPTTFTYKNYQDEDTNAEFPIPKVTVGGGNILVHYYLVNGEGKPINEKGVVVESPSVAKEVKPAAYFEVNDSTGLSYNTPYNVPKENIANYTYSGKYILNNGDLTTGDSVEVTLTAANSNQHVWFAYTQGFKVVHVQDGVAGKADNYTIGDTIEGVYEAGKFNLTAVVPEGYLYGGSFTTKECTTPQTYATGENPTSFTPVAGATYYIWEVDDMYLMPKGLNCWEHNSEGQLDVMGFFTVTAVDRNLYKDIGFKMNGVQTSAAQLSETYIDSNNETKYDYVSSKNAVVYDSVRVVYKSGDGTTYTAKSITTPDSNGYLACYSVGEAYKNYSEEAPLSFAPY